jgi:hypothetical protein
MLSKGSLRHLGSKIPRGPPQRSSAQSGAQRRTIVSIEHPPARKAAQRSPIVKSLMFVLVATVRCAPRLPRPTYESGSWHHAKPTSLGDNPDIFTAWVWPFRAILHLWAMREADQAAAISIGHHAVVRTVVRRLRVESAQHPRTYARFAWERCWARRCGRRRLHRSQTRARRRPQGRQRIAALQDAV